MEIWYLFDGITHQWDWFKKLFGNNICYPQGNNKLRSLCQAKQNSQSLPPQKKDLRMSKKYYKKCLSSTLKEIINKKNKIISHESDWQNLKGLIILSWTRIKKNGNS